jgi:putative addiction module CopG family antidote
MTVVLTPELQRLIDARIKSGKYASPQDVLTAALHSLDSQEHSGDFAPGEMDALLAEGEAGGPSVDGRQVLSDLRHRRPPHQD